MQICRKLCVPRGVCRGLVEVVLRVCTRGQTPQGYSLFNTFHPWMSQQFSIGLHKKLDHSV